MDVIIHLAGKAHDTKNTTEEKTYFDINVGLTQQIFEYFLQSNASKFIFFSSVKAVADNVNGKYLTEDTIPNSKTAYGKSKLEAEKYLAGRIAEYNSSLADAQPERKLPGQPASKVEIAADSNRFLSAFGRPAAKKVYILRPSMIHGPGNKGNLNLLYKLVQKGIPWPLGHFENKRSFTSIKNLQFVIQQLIEKDIEPGTYQIADDQPFSTNSLIRMIAASQGKKARIWKINSKLITLAASIGDKFHLPLNSERLKKLTESYVVSNSKLKQALGIEKMPVNAEKGMRRTLRSFGISSILLLNSP